MERLNNFESSRFECINCDSYDKKLSDKCSFAVVIPSPKTGLGGSGFTNFNNNNSTNVNTIRGPKTQFWILCPITKKEYKVICWEYLDNIKNLKIGSVIILYNYVFKEYKGRHDIELKSSNHSLFYILSYGLKLIPELQITDNNNEWRLFQKLYEGVQFGLDVFTKSKYKIIKSKHAKYKDSTSSSSSNGNYANINCSDNNDGIFAFNFDESNYEYKSAYEFTKMIQSTINKGNNNDFDTDVLFEKGYEIRDAIFLSMLPVHSDITPWRLLKWNDSNGNLVEYLPQVFKMQLDTTIPISSSTCNKIQTLSSTVMTIDVHLNPAMVQRLLGGIPAKALVASIYYNNDSNSNSNSNNSKTKSKPAYEKLLKYSSEWVGLLHRAMQTMIERKTTWRVIVYLRKVDTTPYAFSQAFTNDTMNTDINIDNEVCMGDVGDDNTRSISSRYSYNDTKKLSSFQVVLHRVMTPICAIDN